MFPAEVDLQFQITSSQNIANDIYKKIPTQRPSSKISYFKMIE